MEFINNHSFHYLFSWGRKIITAGLSLQQNKMNCYFPISTVRYLSMKTFITLSKGANNLLFKTNIHFSLHGGLGGKRVSLICKQTHT